MPQAAVQPGTVYTPENVNIQYTGRIDFSNPQQPKFSAPGVSIQACFSGTSAAVLLTDEFKNGQCNYYDILIDDVFVLKLTPKQNVTKYLVADNLPNTEHRIAIVKRTEAAAGYSLFLGFEISGQILPAPAKPHRRIIFIGDSISCGGGNEAVNGSAECLEGGWGQAYCNARLAFGPILAHNLEAEAHLVAVSGIGLVRNYSFQYDTRPLPAVYDSIFFEQRHSPTWDHSAFMPDAIVIALGTNDFSPGESERPLLSQDVFVDAYIKLIYKLRGYHPESHIFCVSSPMLGDGWPEANNQFATDQKQSITKVVSYLKQQGHANIHSFFVKSITGTGCGTHPSVEQHIGMAAELQPFMTRVMGW